MIDALAGSQLDEPTLRMIAAEAYDAFNSGGRHVQPFSARHPGFTLDDVTMRFA